MLSQRVPLVLVALLLVVALLCHSQSGDFTSLVTFLHRLGYKGGETTTYVLQEVVHLTHSLRDLHFLHAFIGTMRSLLATVTLAVYAAVSSAQSSAASAAADAYLAKQVPISRDNVKANIGPDGHRSHGAKPGVVVASPSTNDPDYVYTWTRDAALVFKLIVEQYTRGEDNSHRKRIDDYVDAQAYLQTLDNPSGTMLTGGLGEAKFNIDLTAFTGPWGRPQRDGPPLRATALTAYANWLIKNGNASYVNQNVWPVIKRDLDYSAQFWNYTGFDLWEEVSSSSYFTTASQQRSLHEGAALAKALGHNDAAARYQSQADNVLCFQQSYWNSGRGYMISNTGGGRSGIDANTALASIHNFDPSAGCDATTFQPCSDKALSSLKVYVDSFRSIYPINRGRAANAAVATGRYQEDVYYGGQPWYLTTAAVAEQLYDAIIVWKAEKKIAVTDISLAFFRQFSSGALNTGTYASTTPTYTTLLNAVQNFADGFLEVIAQYTPADGSLAEQYHRDDGHALSAKHLTWSYASVLTAYAARKGEYQVSWNAAGVTLPSVCQSNIGPTANVTFRVRAETVMGENIFLTGSIDQLKGWNPDAAIPLNPSNYPIWTASVSIPVNTRFAYKYIRKQDGRTTWESDPDRTFESPASGAASTNDVWK